MKYCLPFILLISIGANAQLQRYDNFAATTTSASGIGNITQVIPNATVTVFNYPGAGNTCAGGGCVAASTFTSMTGAVACAGGLPLTRPTSTTCVATADASGNFGFWAAAGEYQYCVSSTSITIQCFNAVLGTTTSTVNNIRYVDGVVFPTVQSAINSLPANGGTVQIPCGSYVGPTTIPSNTSLIGACPQWASNKYSGQWGLGPGSVLTIQAVAGVTLTYSANLSFVQVQNITISNIVLDFQSNNAGVIITSSSFIHMDHVIIDRCGGTSSATPCLLLNDVATGGQNNNALNTFDHLAINASPNPFAGTVTGIQLNGTNSSGPAVTQNKFTDIVIGGAIAVALDFLQNCDTNWFYGVVVNSTTASAVGIRFNAVNPTVDHDANAIQILGYSCSSNCASPFLQFGLSAGNYIVTQGNPVAPTILGGVPQYTVVWTGFTVGGGAPTTFTNTPMVINDGVQTNAAFQAGGTAPTLTGTGACATTTTKVGGMMAGNFTCTGTTGASTVTMTFGATAPHWYSCFASDTTHTLNGSQSGTASTTACTMTFTSVTANDIITFGAMAF